MSSAEEFEKYAILKNMFRRRSSTEFTGACFAQVMNADEMPKILNECHSHVNPAELRKQIDQVDPARKPILKSLSVFSLEYKLVIKESTNHYTKNQQVFFKPFVFSLLLQTPAN
ncbi:unnamed protein product [Orchesella dallaii]|uniref:Uncharacterized protein n=1 Tax=Orchesella dallaii TaxID=48710 RepID=A0ABP1RC40_9HEXA